MVYHMACACYMMMMEMRRISCLSHGMCMPYDNDGDEEEDKWSITWQVHTI